MSHPVTRDSVAALAGVSTAVVSYVLNDGPRPVAAATRDRVLAAIEELGYRPNAVARALKTRSTRTVGLVVPDNNNPYFAELATALENAAHRRGYALLLANTSGDEGRLTTQLRALEDRRVDGVFVIGQQVDTSGFGSTRTVGLDRVAPDSAGSTVTVDNVSGAEIGVQHLLSHGHKAIACIAGPGGVSTDDDRERGWRQAATHAGCGTDGLVVRAPFTREGGYAAMQELLRRGPVTAVFASSDVQGIGALRAAWEAGLTVPDDLALLAFDGTDESAFSTPPLTVIDQPTHDMAETALDLLLGDGPDRHIVLQSSLVRRRSCGCQAT